VSEIVERAKALAYRAHAGQVDKAGRPYIEHVARVAAAVDNDSEAEAVAWLHDVMEDCPKFEGEVRSTFPFGISEAVSALTRWHADIHYYASVRSNPIALRVKLADIDDNSDESRLALLDDKTAARLRRKYTKARRALTTQQASEP
jgi:(p)ppGpp synthase/HD superfamily hydrolase